MVERPNCPSLVAVTGIRLQLRSTTGLSEVHLPAYLYWGTLISIVQPRNYRALARRATAAILDDTLQVQALLQVALMESALRDDPFATLRTAIRLIDQHPRLEAAVLYAELAVVLQHLGHTSDAPLQRAETLAEFDRPVEICILLAAARCGLRVKANLSAAESLAQDAGGGDFVERVRQCVAVIYALGGDGGSAFAATRRIRPLGLRTEALSQLGQLSGTQNWGATALDEADELVETIEGVACRCRAYARLARAHHHRGAYSGRWLGKMHESFGRLTAASDLAQCAPILAATLAQHGAIAAAVSFADAIPAHLQSDCHLAICEHLAQIGKVRQTRQLAEWILLPGYRDQALLTIVAAAARAVGVPTFFGQQVLQFILGRGLNLSHLLARFRRASRRSVFMCPVGVLFERLIPRFWSWHQCLLFPSISK